MIKFNKVYNLALIFTLIGILLCPDLSYSTTLRVPLGLDGEKAKVAIEHFRRESELKPITETDIKDIEDGIEDIDFNGFEVAVTKDNFPLILPTLKGSAEKLPGARQVFVIRDDKGKISQVVLAREMYRMADREAASENIRDTASDTVKTDGAMSRRDFLKKLIIYTVALSLPSIYAPPVYSGDLSIQPTEKEALEYSDKNLKIITQLLKSSVEEYNNALIRLSSSEEKVDSSVMAQLVFDTVGKTVTEILNTYGWKTPEIKRELEKIPREELSRLSFEKGMDVLSGYYKSFNKYFRMRFLSGSLNGRYFSHIYSFILADETEIPGVDGFNLELPDADLEVNEVAIQNIRISPLLKMGGWADKSDNSIVYNLDASRDSAEHAWDLINQYPDPLDISELIQLIREGRSRMKELTDRGRARIYFEQFAEAIEKGKDYFIDEFIKADRCVTGIHEFSHFVFWKENKRKADEEFSNIMDETKAYQNSLGYSKYPYLALKTILEASHVEGDSDLYSNRHGKTANLLVSFIVNYIWRTPTRINTNYPEDFSPLQLGYFYTNQSHLLTTEQLIEIGRMSLTFESNEDGDSGSESKKTGSIEKGAGAFLASAGFSDGNNLDKKRVTDAIRDRLLKKLSPVILNNIDNSSLYIEEKIKRGLDALRKGDLEENKALLLMIEENVDKALKLNEGGVIEASNKLCKASPELATGKIEEALENPVGFAAVFNNKTISINKLERDPSPKDYQRIATSFYNTVVLSRAYNMLLKLKKREVILNTKGETFDDVWRRMRKAGLLKDVTDPRTWPIDPEEREFVTQYARMSLEELQGVLVELVRTNIIESSTWITKEKDPLLVFIDSLSEPYVEMFHHSKSAVRRIAFIKSGIAFSKEKGTFSNEREALYDKLLLGSYKYKAFMRELMERWSNPSALESIQRKLQNIEAAQKDL